MLFKKTYFLPPTSDFLAPPPTGPIALGSIIANTDEPQRPLNTGALQSVESEHVESFTQPNWEKTISTSTGRGIGVYAQFLQLAGFDAELSIDHSKSNSSILAFDVVKTERFEPSKEYVARAVKAAGVQHHMRKRGLARARQPVYLVTGIKVVSGAKVEFSDSRSLDNTAKIGVDGAIAGVPVKFGPKAHWTKKTDEMTGFERPSEFLFAFRVKKVSYKHGELEDDDYDEGAFLSTDPKSEEHDQIETEEMALDEDAGAKVIDEEDGEEVLCVFPQA